MISAFPLAPVAKENSLSHSSFYLYTVLNYNGSNYENTSSQTVKSVHWSFPMGSLWLCVPVPHCEASFEYCLYYYLSKISHCPLKCWNVSVIELSGITSNCLRLRSILLLIPLLICILKHCVLRTKSCRDQQNAFLETF